MFYLVLIIWLVLVLVLNILLIYKKQEVSPEEMTPLEKFILENEPFRKRLYEVLVSVQPKIAVGHCVPFKDEILKA